MIAGQAERKKGVFCEYMSGGKWATRHKTRQFICNTSLSSEMSTVALACHMLISQVAVCKITEMCKITLRSMHKNGWYKFSKDRLGGWTTNQLLRLTSLSRLLIHLETLRVVTSNCLLVFKLLNFFSFWNCFGYKWFVSAIEVFKAYLQILNEYSSSVFIKNHLEAFPHFIPARC